MCLQSGTIYAELTNNSSSERRQRAGAARASMHQAATHQHLLLQDAPAKFCSSRAAIGERCAVSLINLDVQPWLWLHMSICNEIIEPRTCLGGQSSTLEVLEYFFPVGRICLIEAINLLFMAAYCQC